MSRIITILRTDLRHLIADLGNDGGLISPSVYDTAQVIRMAPPAQDVGPALEWLLDQQQLDGGWGNPQVPLARDLPTLAAVLALLPHSAHRNAIQAGVAFLYRQMGQWAGPLPDDIPVGVELLLPWMLEEAAHAGLELPRAPYAALQTLGQRRRALIARLTLRPGTTPTHSWEALNIAPDPALIDGSGGIGHSPTATAAWLRATANRPELSAQRAAAQRFLDQAAAATSVGVPGVYPTVWPINRFELAFGLYALLLAGLLDHPALNDVIAPQIEQLARSFAPAGLGMSDHFVVDGDITATGLAVLAASGRHPSADTMQRFRDGDHYFTYPGEFQPSLSTTAHAIHALALLGADVAGPVRYLLSRQGHDGRWMGDKWHGSWLYTTGHIGIGLAQAGANDTLSATATAFKAHQHSDGGWGVVHSTVEETAHTVMFLRTMHHRGALDAQYRLALLRGEQWLLARYQPFGEREADAWIGKEVYIPHRVSRIMELAALFSSQIPDELNLARPRERAYVLR